ncbi:peritrophin-48 [Aedes aegypti]|uniref:Chitin-binding type-2 domain-containing protein n=1 Tax=Aedes aegypti TaxID=7159 RepID=A0A6I8T5G5_AEDAE|nr:peritrophin-48 [Aedes aegypti]
MAPNLEPNRRWSDLKYKSPLGCDRATYYLWWIAKMRVSRLSLLALVAFVSFGNAEKRNYDEVCIGAPNLSYVASRISCEYYYACIDGVAYGYRCEDGEWFSIERQQCVPPSESDCDIDQAPELPTAPPPTTSPMCEGVENYRYVRSFDNCQYYYQCIDEFAYQLSCPKSFWFNEEQQRCGNRYEFDCDLETTTRPPPPPPGNRCLGQPNFGLIYDPDYCYRFFKCMNGLPFPMVCWDGLWFDYASQTCVEPSETNCSATTPPPNPPPVPNICDDVEDGHSVLHYRFCNAYFTCENQVGTPGQCRDGLWFDEDRQECAHAMDAYCPHGIVTTPRPDVCSGVEDGRLVASPDSCSAYYVCANENGYRAFCPPGQYFDEERQMCDDQQNVDCLI